jgi:hypothetical protein
MFNFIKNMAKKKVIEEFEIVEAVTKEDYINEFRVYTDGTDFKSFDTVEEAQAEVEANGGSISVASVK